MQAEKLIGETITNRKGEKLTIISIDEMENIEKTRLHLSNGKLLNLYISYKNGFIRFDNDGFNNEMDSLLKKEKKIEESEIKKKEAERKEIQQFENMCFSGTVSEFRNEYYFLSNFYECSVSYKGLTYRNSEAAFQAQKDLSKQELFVALSGAQARKLGKSRTQIKLREGWNDLRLPIMKEILKCKFDQNPELKKALMNTGNKYLIEGNTWNDTFWGVCRCKGQNNLGVLLMKLRKKYQDESK